VGTLIRGRYILTSSEPASIEDGAVRVVGERVDSVGPWEALRRAFPEDKVTGGPHDIVTPGFVNTHGHFSEGLVTGIAEQYTLWEWLGALIRPVAFHLDEEMAYVGTLLAGVQMLRSGITLANDMFVYHPTGDRPATVGVVRAVDELGIRAVLSFGAEDTYAPIPLSRLMDEHAALAEATAASRLSRFRVGVVAVLAQSPELFAATVRLAVDGGHGVHVHLQEVREEVTAARMTFGVTTIAHCARSGLFDASTLGAHCVWVDAADRELLAEHGVGVAHNPVANMILASGVCPVSELRGLGIHVGLGVDGPASNDRQDMLEVIKMAVLLQRIDRLQATALQARDALEMATIGGAAALGLAAELGSIAVGKAADLVVFDGTSPALANVHDPFQAVVYCAGPREVKDVWVAGARAVVGGEVVGVDVAEAVARSRPLARTLAQKAGLGGLSRLA